MPNSVFHMWIAREFAKNYRHLLNDPNYYLGNIAPDAILGRAGCTDEMKSKSHKHSDSRLPSKSFKDLINGYKNQNKRRTYSVACPIKP